jgi:hypothetical protein
MRAISSPGVTDFAVISPFFAFPSFGDCWAGCSNASTFALNSVEVAFIVGYPLISLIDLKYDTH